MRCRVIDQEISSGTGVIGFDIGHLRRSHLLGADNEGPAVSSDAVDGVEQFAHVGEEREFQCDQYPAISLRSVAVHIRPTMLSRAACQSNVTCTPCGPGISMRGRGRNTECATIWKVSPVPSAL